MRRLIEFQIKTQIHSELKTTSYAIDIWLGLGHVAEDNGKLRERKVINHQRHEFKK